MTKCSCTRPATAAEDRAYDAQVKALKAQDPTGRAARAWIDQQHEQYKVTEARCRRAHGGIW